MRLFRRRQDSPPAPDPAPEAPAADGQDVARPERAPTGDWMTVAPLPTTVRPIPPTFRVQTLPEILTSHQSVRLSGTLGHSVSPEAPSGSVQGLAVTNPGVHEVTGHGDLPLRTPHLPEPAPLQPLTIRRLAISDSPEPAAAPAPALPEPVVSRVLANPAPLANPPAAPLPVARVVDSGLSSPTVAAAPSSASPSVSEGAASPAADSAPDSDAGRDPGAPAAGAPLVGDDRVGGFAVNLDALATPGPTSELRRPAPPELAPPIQPRTLQRRANPLNPPLQRSTSGAAGSAATTPSAPDAEMPLAVSRDTGAATGGAAATGATASAVSPAIAQEWPSTTPSSPPGATTVPGSSSTPATGTGTTPAAEPPGASGSGPAGATATGGDDPSLEPLAVQTAPLVGEAPPAGAEAIAPVEPAETAPPAALVLRQPATPAATEDRPVPPAPAADAPLVAGDLPSRSALAPESPDTPLAPTPSRPDVLTTPRVDLPLHRPPGAPGTSAAPSAPAVQRLAESGGSSAPSPPSAAAAFTAAHDSLPATVDVVSDEPVIAPLAGENPLGSAEPAAASAASPAVASTHEMPLVAPGGAGDAGVPPQSWSDSPSAETQGGSPAEPVMVPTLGMGAGDLALQTSPDASSSGIAGISSPSSAPPPAGVSGLPLAPLEQPGTLGVPASAGPNTQASGAPLARPLAAPSSVGGASPTATTATPLQRMASPGPAAGSDGTATSTTTAGPLQTTVQLAAPGVHTGPRFGSSPADPTSLPLQRVGVSGVAATAVAPTAVAKAPPVSATPVLRRLSATAAAPSGTGAGSPAASLQRVDSAGAPATTNGAAASSSTGTAGPLPLHTPAAAVPTAADVAVKAGLAERQADGSLLYTSPPGGGAVPETVVQRVNETGTAAAAPVAAAAGDLPSNAAAPAAGAPGAGAAGAGQSPEELDLLARRLYKRLRSEMQADIAKQLEAKNRAGRYRR